MKFADILLAIKEFWQDFHKVKYGIVGVIIIMLAVLIAVFEGYILPFEEANTRWRDITYWDDNVLSAPPMWTNLFRKNKLPTTEFLDPKKQYEDQWETFKVTKIEFIYNFKSVETPLDMIFKCTGTGKLPIMINLERPDGVSLDLIKNVFDVNDDDIRISLNREAYENALDFLKSFETADNIEQLDVGYNNAVPLLFAEAKEGYVLTRSNLKGKYKIVVTILLLTDDIVLEKPKLIISGRVSGILGTDDSKRDLFSGVIAGIKWALIIGLLIATITVTIGLIYGVVSAYFGGFIDDAMQRIYEFFISIPLLPIMIVIAAIFKPNMWVLIGVICLFFWTGSVKTIRSMALQIREEIFVEASKALGAKHGRIIFRHIAPILLPLAFSNMALGVPAAIVLEAGLSILGLGDPSIVTWGQILQDALARGAMINGMWWWIIPPGLIMSILSMSFAFISFAMDKILHPKLRTR